MGGQTGGGRRQDRLVRGKPRMTDTGAPEPPIEMTRRAIEQLEVERDMLERLLLRLPSLLAELDPERLSVGVVEAARELTGARFGLFLAAGSERATVSFVGLTREDFAAPPAVGRAPVLAGAVGSGESLRIDDVATWAKSEEAARSYGVLADGRLVRSWLAIPVRGWSTAPSSPSGAGWRAPCPRACCRRSCLPCPASTPPPATGRAVPMTPV